MNTKYKFPLLLLSLLAIASLASACQQDANTQSLDQPTDTSTSKKSQTVNPSIFVKDGLAEEITKEPCTLSGGTKTTCYRITTVTSKPSDHQAGPWCPSNLTATAEAGGIWIEEGKVYDVDGNFIENLDTFYQDDKWKLYNEDGTVKVTKSKEECAAAARPNVDEKYQNHCVQCLPEYVEEDAAVQTFVIPATPVEQTQSNEINPTGTIGVAFNGVTYDPPAPTEAILSAHTLAPFDDCGGHINLHGGYHYHAHTGCPKEVEQSDSHAPAIGYALDGFTMYASLNETGEEAQDLDQCRGEYDEVRGYHYHVADAGSNSFINCFKGEQGCKFNGDGNGEICDASATSDRPGKPPNGERGNKGAGKPPDFSEAAAQLGITVDELMTALGKPPFDLDNAAVQLGITTEELQEVLPPRP